MPAEHGASAPDSDDFDRRLRELASGGGGEAKFTEPSAAERAKQAARRSQARPGSPPRTRTWGGARRARRLRKPVSYPGQAAGKGPRRRIVRAGRRPAGNRTPRAQRLRSAAKIAAIAAAFVLLVLLLHALGFGPQ
jgi:hypothetical protein